MTRIAATEPLTAPSSPTAPTTPATPAAAASDVVETLAPPGVLGRIVERTLRDLRAKPAVAPSLSAARAPEVGLDDDSRGARFIAALAGPGLRLIAEIKPRSPSRGPLLPRRRVDAYLASVEPHAAALSVLVDGPFFGGGFDLLAQIRGKTTLPLLAKGFFVAHSQIAAAAAAGANAVLLMASVLPEASLQRLLDDVRRHGLEALVEAHNDDEIAVALRCGARVVGVNARDLTTLALDPRRARRLLGSLPADGSVVRVAESGLVARADVDALVGLADAALIGTHLSNAADAGAAARALGFNACSPKNEGAAP